MRITSIAIENFRALRRFELEDIPELVVLAGPNGTGKSSVLEAIAIWKENVAPYHSHLGFGRDAISAGETEASIRVTLELADDEVEFARHELERRGQGVPPPDSRRLRGLIFFDRDGNVRREISEGQAYAQMIREIDRSRPIGVMEYIGAHRRMPASDITAVPITPITPERERITRLYDVDSKFNEVKQYLIALEVQDWQRVYYEEGKRADSTREIKDLFSVFFSPKAFIGARSVETPQGPRISLRIETPAGEHDIDSLSSGEKEVLMVFATLHRLRLTNSVLLYDEPELHLNAALERKVIPELVRLGAGNQIWVSTHSVEIINSTAIENLFVLSHFENQNQVRRAEADRDRFQLFEALGARIGLLLVSERIVFVEGEDTSADRELLEAIFADHRSQVSFVPSGSVSGVHAAGAAGVELWRRASTYNEFFLIRDRDFAEHSEIKALEKRLRGRLWVWSAHHIENFLMNPEAIRRALNRSGITTFHSADDVDVALREIADSLKEEVLARWIGSRLNRKIGWLNFRITGGNDPLQQVRDRAAANVERVAKNLEEMNVAELETAAERAMACWDYGWWRLIVPGKRVMNLFTNRHGQGIPYERLRGLILAEMREDESLWPAEFEQLRRRLLQDIT